MKKLLYAITIAVTMLSGCTNNSTKDNERKSKEVICPISQEIGENSGVVDKIE